MKTKAFTLVELIVVITILAILWTIVFISLSWYSKEARDSKRITDTSSLLSKINIEEVRWTLLSDLINWRDEQIRILWKENSPVKTFWKANFQTLKEEAKNFEDPRKKGQHYPVAYAIGWEWKDAYKFVQIATVSEKENRNIIKWNYYTLSWADDESLFHSGTTYTENKPTLVYDLEWVVPKEPETPEGPIWPEDCEDWTFWNWTKCIENPNKDQEFSNEILSFSKEVYPWCDTPNIIIKNWEDNIEIAACDVWSSKSWIWEDSHWNFYQWGNNKAWPSNWDLTLLKPTILDASSYWPDTGKWYFEDKNLTPSSMSDEPFDWSISDNPKLWWYWVSKNNIINKEEILVPNQWPCNKWYHVPTIEELKTLIDVWFNSKWRNCVTQIDESCSWWLGEFNDFISDFNFTLTWTRGMYDWKIYWKWEYNYYLSNTPEAWQKAFDIYFDKNEIVPQKKVHRSWWGSLRCFKN